MGERVVAFVGLAAVLTAIPGPAVMLIMKSAVLRGRRSAALTALGVFSGDLVWVTTSICGLTALLVASRPGFEVLRVVGAAYLIYLGLRLLLRGSHRPPEVAEAGEERRGGRRAFGEGALCELSNPKTLVVFTGVIPPFLPPGAGPVALLVFGSVFATTGLAVCLVYAAVLGATGRAVRRPRLARALLRGGGGVLTAFGLGLATEALREA